MKLAFVVAVAVMALAVAPTTVVEPVDACQPYEVYCPLTGQYYRGCGTMKPMDAPLVQCIRDLP